MILLTGATGFTGAYVLDELLNEGYKVRCFVRKSSDISNLSNKQVEIVYGDFGQFDTIVEALKGVDILINVSSLGFGHASDIIKACEQCGIKRAIFFSTTGIFTNLNPQSKEIRLNAENLIKRSNIDYTILRPTMIYGTHKDRNICRLVKYLYKIRIIPVLGGGEYLLQPVYVKDLAHSAILMLKNSMSINNEYNIAGGNALTYNELVDTTANELGIKVLKLHIPLFICLFLLKIYEKITKNPKIKYEQALRLNENKNFSIQKAVNELGYKPLCYNKGIKNEIDEMRRKSIL